MGGMYAAGTLAGWLLSAVVSGESDKRGGGGGRVLYLLLPPGGGPWATSRAAQSGLRETTVCHLDLAPGR